MSSLDRILPFLQPIEDLLRDPAITEVMVNAGGRRVFVERDGAVEAVPDRTLEVRNLTVAIKNIARACGDEISDAPADSRRSARGRVARRRDVPAMRRRRSDADRPEVHVPLHARRPRRRRHADRATWPSMLRHAVDARQNVLISGGTGTGKTTLLNAVAQTIPAERPDRPDRGDLRDPHRQAEPRPF